MTDRLDWEKVRRQRLLTQKRATTQPPPRNTKLIRQLDEQERGPASRQEQERLRRARLKSTFVPNRPPVGGALPIKQERPRP